MCINMGINYLVTKHIRLVTATILLEMLSTNHLIPNIEAASPRIGQSLIQNKLRPSTLQDVVFHPVVVLLCYWYHEVVPNFNKISNLNGNIIMHPILFIIHLRNLLHYSSTVHRYKALNFPVLYMAQSAH
jgi:hypothetical protein